MTYYILKKIYAEKGSEIYAEKKYWLEQFRFHSSSLSVFRNIESWTSSWVKQYWLHFCILNLIVSAFVFFLVKMSLNNWVIDRDFLFELGKIEEEVDEEQLYSNANYTQSLEAAIRSISPTRVYIGCVNCRYPVAFCTEIADIIYNSRFPSIPIAYVLPVYQYSLAIGYTNIIDGSLVHWRTRVQCCNCRINLTITALTIYNSAIDDYDHEEPCIILDAGSVSFFRNNLPRI